MKFEPRLIARDPTTGKTVTFHVLPDGRYAVDTVMDVEPILEQNKILAAAAAAGWKKPGLDMHHVASIDMRVLQQLRAEGRWQDPKDRAKWLNDPANSKWRTKGGRV